VEAGALENAVDGVLRRVEGEADDVEVCGRDPTTAARLSYVVDVAARRARDRAAGVALSQQRHDLVRDQVPR